MFSRNKTNLADLYARFSDNGQMKNLIVKIITVAAIPAPRCMCMLASGDTILPLLVYRDPDGIKIDSTGTNRQKLQAVKSYLRLHPHILMWMRQKEGKLRSPSSDDNAWVARKYIPYVSICLFCLPIRVHKIKSSGMAWQNGFAYWPKIK